MLLVRSGSNDWKQGAESAFLDCLGTDSEVDVGEGEAQHTSSIFDSAIIVQNPERQGRGSLDTDCAYILDTARDPELLWWNPLEKPGICPHMSGFNSSSGGKGGTSSATNSEGGHSSSGMMYDYTSANSSKEWAADIHETVSQCTLMAERWRTARQLRGDAASRILSDAQALLNIAKRGHASPERVPPPSHPQQPNILPPRAEQPAIRRNRRPAVTGPQANTKMWECRIKRPNKLQSHRCKIELAPGTIHFFLKKKGRFFPLLELTITARLSVIVLRATCPRSTVYVRALAPRSCPYILNYLFGCMICWK
jgi:hypothetical protein